MLFLCPTLYPPFISPFFFVSSPPFLYIFPPFRSIWLSVPSLDPTLFSFTHSSSISLCILSSCLLYISPISLYHHLFSPISPLPLISVLLNLAFPIFLHISSISSPLSFVLPYSFITPLFSFQSSVSLSSPALCYVSSYWSHCPLSISPIFPLSIPLFSPISLYFCLLFSTLSLSSPVSTHFACNSSLI